MKGLKMEYTQTEFDLETERENPKNKLAAVVGYVQALSGGTLKKMARLSEYATILTVRWHKPPTETEKAIFNDAWKAQGGLNGTVCHAPSERSVIVGAFCEVFGSKSLNPAE
jgi:hypothetical protein